MHENCLLENFMNSVSFLYENLSIEALRIIPSISVTILLSILVLLIDKEKYPIDLIIVFKQFKFKWIIFFSISDIVFLCLADIEFIFLFVVILSVLIIGFDIMGLVNLYKCICSFDYKDKASYMQKKRIKYLDSLNNADEIIDTWELMLNCKNLAILPQYGIVDSYIKAAKKLKIQDAEYKQTIKSGIMMYFDKCYLNKFYLFFRNNLNKISFSNLTCYLELVKFLFRIYLEIYPNNKDYYLSNGLYRSIDSKKIISSKEFMFLLDLFKVGYKNIYRMDMVDFSIDFFNCVINSEYENYMVDKSSSSVFINRGFVIHYVSLLLFKANITAVDRKGILNTCFIRWTSQSPKLINGKLFCITRNIINDYRTFIDLLDFQHIDEYNIKFLANLTKKIFPAIELRFCLSVLFLFENEQGKMFIIKPEEHASQLIYKFCDTYIQFNSLLKKFFDKNMKLDETICTLLKFFYPFLNNDKVINVLEKEIKNIIKACGDNENPAIDYIMFIVDKIKKYIKDNKEV